MPTGDRSWASRVAAFGQERPAQWAIVAAMFSLMAALGAWTAVLLPGAGDIRFNPMFWLLAALPMVWMGALGAGAQWAFRLIWVVLILSPCLCVAAMIAASDLDPLDLGGTLATPAAMLVILGISAVLSGAGGVALRRTSLPGGARPIHFERPGILPPGRFPVPPDAMRAMMIGSLAMSATLINGMIFGIVLFVSVLVSNDQAGWRDFLRAAWPVAILIPLIVAVGVHLFRGSARLTKRSPGAFDDLRRGWRMGMICAPAFLLLLWAWPVPIALKGGFSIFMVPLTVAGIWGGRSALRRLPAVIASL